MNQAIAFDDYTTSNPFLDRQRTLREIYSNLNSKPAQCCAVIGEMFIGKTTLLHHLESTLKSQNWRIVYLNCEAYTDMSNLADYGSAMFWQDLREAVQSIVQVSPQSSSPVKKNTTTSSVPPKETALKCKLEVERLIEKSSDWVVILLDNFEGVASLPIRDSRWLRSMVQQYQCVYVVASRYLLHLSYHFDPEQNINDSPLWNLFSEPIYLGLLDEDEVNRFLTQANRDEEEQVKLWSPDDIDFIKRFAGRHPQLLRIVCQRLLKHRLQVHDSAQEKPDFLEYEIYQDALSTCDVLWHNLANSELRGEHRSGGFYPEKDKILSPHQQVMLALAKGHSTEDISLDQKYATTVEEILFTLNERGFIEKKHGKWCVFSELMRRFVLKQEHLYQEYQYGENSSGAVRQPSSSTMTMTQVSTKVLKEEQGIRSDFTPLEELVYDYLRQHAGKLCSRQEIMQAVWKNKFPSHSALQKLIERIRTKIEPDPENSRYLIAVKGQGYMLRDVPISDSSQK